MAGSIQISSDVPAAVGPSKSPVNPEDFAKSDLWIFREGRREFSGPAFLRELQGRLAAKNALLDCLIQAGELEAALADLAAPGASAAAALTDSLASRLCAPPDAHDPEQLARRIEVPDTISISPPEGFTYYALHPLDFARTAEDLAKESETYAVIGIRSIGTTLSAVTAAKLTGLGKKSTRITVRPEGHPYSRSAQFSPSARAWILQQQSLSAHFLIVDEGPGRSGSTFLSVAEALCRAGVPQDRMTIVGSRPFDPAALCAQAAAERWRRFHFVCASSLLGQRFEDWTYIGSGDWRKYFCNAEPSWPESWTQMERLKVLSNNGNEFVKFEGMGRIGKEAYERALVLAKAGFSPSVSNAGDGFLAYTAIGGRLLRKEDLNPEVLERIARYCAFRNSELTCTDTIKSELEHMLVYNVQEEFGRELKLVPGDLAHFRPTLADGRMQPYEWVACGHGQILKTDAISHGDNHFFPGPCGIAWDLAGTIVEWDLGASAAEFLLRKFREFSGSGASSNLKSYMLAYCVFRLGFCKMARSTVRGTNEEIRLDLAYRQYRAKAARLLGAFSVT